MKKRPAPMLVEAPGSTVEYVTAQIRARPSRASPRPIRNWTLMRSWERRNGSYKNENESEGYQTYSEYCPPLVSGGYRHHPAIGPAPVECDNPVSGPEIDFRHRTYTRLR